MGEGYKSISVKFSTYQKLKKLSEETGKSISKVLEDLISNSGEVKGFDENTIQKIVHEEISNALKEIKAMLYNMISESNKPEREKRKSIKALKEAFLGERSPIAMRKVPIQISKGNIFVEVKEEKPKIDLSKFKAEIVAETNEKGEIIGYSIIPNIGFENMSLEDWFDEYGAELIKELTSILS